MKQQSVEQIIKMIRKNDTLSSTEKDELIHSLELLTKYNVDLNKNEDLIKLILDSKDFLLEKDGMNREDKLLSKYGLTPDSTKEEVEAVRDSIIDQLYKLSTETKYIDRYKDYKREICRVDREFKLILSRFEKRTLSGDLSKETVKADKVKAFKDYAALAGLLSQFAVETESENEVEDVSNDTFNYVYEGMSDDEIKEAQEDLNSRPINYASYGNNTKEYLEPIEYFPNTNIRKPRAQGPYESTEHYNSFLTEYYSRYDFSNPQPTPADETGKFYSDKLEYIKDEIHDYFTDIRKAMANLRWFYNYSLNTIANNESDIEFYEEKLAEEADKADEYNGYINDAKQNNEVLQEFISEYDEKLDSLNSVLGAVYNEPSLKGDTSITIELSTNGDEVTATVSPLVTLVDDENRKKYANYEVDEDKKIPYDEYTFNLKDVTNKDLDGMLLEFVTNLHEDGYTDIDVETFKNSNIELVVDGEELVMPFNDFGINAFRALQLDKDNNYVKTNTYKDDEKVLTLIKRNVVTQPVVEEVKEEVQEAPAVVEAQEDIPVEIPELKTDAIHQWDSRLTEEQILDAISRDIYEPVGPEYEQFLSEVGLSKPAAAAEEVTETPEVVETQEEIPVEVEEPTKEVVEEQQSEEPEEEVEENNEAEVDESLVEENTTEDIEEPTKAFADVEPTLGLPLLDDAEETEDLQTPEEVIEENFDDAFEEEKEEVKTEEPVETPEEEKTEDDGIEEDLPITEPSDEDEEVDFDPFELEENLDTEEELTDEESPLNKNFDDYHSMEHDDDDIEYDEDEGYSEIEEPKKKLRLGELEDQKFTQEELHDFYKVTAVRKPKNFAKTVAAGIVGGAMALFGVLATHPLVAVGGSIALVGDVIANWKNVYRAIQKLKLKFIAKKNGARVLFGREGIKMINADGEELDREKAEDIQDDIDKLINSRFDPKYVPQVTLSNLEDSFIRQDDDEEELEKTPAEETEEKDEVQEMVENINDTVENSLGDAYTQDALDFDPFEDEDDVEDLVINEPVQEETKEAPAEESKEPEEEIPEDVLFDNIVKNNNKYAVEIDPYQRSLAETLLILNHDLDGHIKEDSEGLFIECDNPEALVLPEGYEYIKGVGISNLDSNPDRIVTIDVVSKINYDQENNISQEVIDSIIAKYGDTLRGLNPEDIPTYFSNESEYSFDEIEAAINAYQAGKTK